MWKTPFFLGMLLSLKVSAETCNTKSVEGILAPFKDSSRERELLMAENNAVQALKEKTLIRPRPEIGLGFEANKGSLKKNELSAEVLFNLDDYRRFNSLSQATSASAGLMELKSISESRERVVAAAMTHFKYIQNRHYLSKIENALGLITSSLNNYEKRPLRSRDEETTLVSLRMMKKNMLLKKTMIEEEMMSASIKLSVWRVEECANNGNFQSLFKEIENYKASSATGESLKLSELARFSEQTIAESEVNRKYSLSNFKIGPTFARDNLGDEKEIRFGVAVSMDFPTFSSSKEEAVIGHVKNSASLQKKYAEADFEAEKNVLKKRIERYLGMLKTYASGDAEQDVLKLKKTFDQGTLSPLVYIDSYRNYIDSLEIILNAQGVVLESHLRLRGFYEKNDLF